MSGTTNPKNVDDQKLAYSDYIPGCFSSLCAIQSEFYAREWGFDQRYESVVAASVSEFLTRYHPTKDFVRLVLKNKTIVGGIVIDHHDGAEGQLRWFILCDQLRGSGAGKRLMTEAMSFVRKERLKSVYLTTFSGLNAARHLYESFGFTLSQEKIASTWGKKITEQRFDWFA